MSKKKKEKEPTQEELLATGTALCVCSYIARNRKTYDAFQKEVAGKCSKSAIKQFMMDNKASFFNSKFAQVRSAALCLKTLEVYAAFYILSNPKNTKHPDSSIVEDFLSRFLWKHRPRYATEITKLKGKYPEKDTFFGQQAPAYVPTIDELSENVSCYRIMLIKYKNGHPEAPSPFESDAPYLQSADNFIMLAPQAPSGGIQKSGRISMVERYFRNLLLGDEEFPVLEQYFDDDNARLLMAIESEFCNGSILSYKFTEKDANTLARNIADILKTFLSFDQLHQNRDELPSLDEFMKAQEDSFDDYDRLMNEVNKLDLNYVRLLYAYSRIVKNDRDELATMYIERIPEESSNKNIISKEEASRIQRESAEKDALLQKKQEELNRVQMDLDREKKRSSDWKEKYHEASGSLQEMQKLIEAISSKSTQVDNIESGEKYSFPTNTVLFGGHPNWQRKFKLLYPDVKVYTADEMGFPPDVIRNADLLLLNVTHMAHKQYYRIIQEVRRHHKKIEYIN